MEGDGNGLIAALVHALEERFGMEVDVRDYHQHAMAKGEDASAAAYVEATSTTTPSGASPSTRDRHCLVRAVVNAVNRASLRSARGGAVAAFDRPETPAQTSFAGRVTRGTAFLAPTRRKSAWTLSAWIVIAAVAALVVVLLAAWSYAKSRRRMALRDQFGREYDRTVDSAGSRRKAERELAEREKAHESLDIQPLSEAARDRYVDDWQQAERRFVDDPELAAREANRT